MLDKRLLAWNAGEPRIPSAIFPCCTGVVRQATKSGTLGCSRTAILPGHFPRSFLPTLHSRMPLTSAAPKVVCDCGGGGWICLTGRRKDRSEQISVDHYLEEQQVLCKARHRVLKTKREHLSRKLWPLPYSSSDQHRITARGYALWSFQNVSA